VNVPIPVGAVPSQNQAALDSWPKYSADSKMIVISADGGTVWDFGQAIYFPADFTGVAPEFRGKYATKYMRKWDLTGDGLLYPYDNKFTPTAMKVPLLHGMVTYDEVVNKGVIDHAVAIASHGMCNAAHISIYPSGQTWPTQTEFSDSPNCLQGGERFYLDASVDCDSLATSYLAEKMVCKALQTYGGIFMENDGHGYSAVYFQNPYGQSWSWSGIKPGMLSNIPADKLRISLPIYPSKKGNSPFSASPPLKN
jgi:hypothetical protein